MRCGRSDEEHLRPERINILLTANGNNTESVKTEHHRTICCSRSVNDKIHDVVLRRIIRTDDRKESCGLKITAMKESGRMNDTTIDEIGMDTMKRKNMKSGVLSLYGAAAAVLTAGLIVGTIAAPAEVQAAPAYNSKYTQTISMQELMLPALKNKWNNGDLQAEQIKQAMRFDQMDQEDVMKLVSQGVTIPADGLKKLADEGMITRYLYKFLSGEPYEPKDFEGVFDAAYYYGANPDLMAAGIPYDENTLFQHFLTQGMAQGRVASAEFNPQIFRANYPKMTKDVDNATLYVMYLIYGKDDKLVADHLLKGAAKN